MKNIIDTADQNDVLAPVRAEGMGSVGEAFEAFYNEADQVPGIRTSVASGIPHERISEAQTMLAERGLPSDSFDSLTPAQQKLVHGTVITLEKDALSVSDDLAEWDRPEVDCKFIDADMLLKLLRDPSSLGVPAGLEVHTAKLLVAKMEFSPGFTLEQFEEIARADVPLAEMVWARIVSTTPELAEKVRESYMEDLMAKLDSLGIALPEEGSQDLSTEGAGVSSTMRLRTAGTLAFAGLGTMGCGPTDLVTVPISILTWRLDWTLTIGGIILGRYFARRSGYLRGDSWLGFGRGMFDRDRASAYGRLRQASKGVKTPSLAIGRIREGTDAKAESLRNSTLPREMTTFARRIKEALALVNKKPCLIEDLADVLEHGVSSGTGWDGGELEIDFPDGHPLSTPGHLSSVTCARGIRELMEEITRLMNDPITADFDNRLRQVSEELGRINERLAAMMREVRNGGRRRGSNTGRDGGDNEGDGHEKKEGGKALAWKFLNSPLGLKVAGGVISAILLAIILSLVCGKDSSRNKAVDDWIEADKIREAVEKADRVDSEFSGNKPEGYVPVE